MRSRILLLMLIVGWSSAGAEDLSIHYRITVENPTDHYFKVEVLLDHVKEEYVDLQMPVWSPGRYVVLDFSRNVRDFTAAENGAALSFSKIDKNTWRIHPDKGETVQVSYRVYANTLSGEYSQLDDVHGFLDGASLYMYVVGKKHLPVTLEVINYPGWMILSAAGELGQTVFSFPNYDLLIDHLVQVGIFFVERFTVENTEYRVSILNNQVRTSLAQFVENLRKITAAAVRMLGPLDTERYTYFFHFLPDSKNTVGMEHLNCCQVTRKHDLMDASQDLMDWTYWITAHEFAHAWNVKRLRPVGLGPFDYDQEVYTELLWFVEGCTSYLADLIMLRSGLWNSEDFLQRVEENLKSYRASPGMYERSVEQASFDTWLWWEDQYAENDWNNVWINYYLKGNLIGYCLDLELRHLTRNEVTFVDFFRELYDRFYTHAEAETYYLKGKGYRTSDLLRTLQSLTHTFWHPFYRQLIASPGDIPFEDYFSFAGFNVKEQPSRPPLLYHGLRLAPAPGGYPRIDWIEEGSPADRADLDRDDLLLAFDGERVLMSDFNAVLSRHAVDEEVEVTLMRDDRLLQRVMRLDLTQKLFNYSLEPDPKASPLALQLRRDWLRQF